MSHRCHQRSVRAAQLRGVGAVALSFGALLLAGCTTTSTVQVESGFPVPVIEPLPLSAGVHFSEQLRSFAHQETIPQHSEWRFELGRANVAMFEPMFDAMFDRVVRIDDIPPEGGSGPLHILIAPHLERFEFDIPRSRDVKFVEVWLQYRLHIYAPDGTAIAEWPVTGYGKSKASGSMPRGSLRDATVRAMREAGATISIRFASQPDVKDWLQEIKNGYDALNAGR